MSAVESRVEQFLGDVEAQVQLAIRDAGREAASRPGAPSDTRGEVTGALWGRIGSNARHAKAQERGAYIVPKQRRALRYASGRFSMRTRLPAKRYLERTARRWGDILLPRLRGA
jgi:hypothetical protein